MSSECPCTNKYKGRSLKVQKMPFTSHLVQCAELNGMCPYITKQFIIIHWIWHWTNQTSIVFRVNFKILQQGKKEKKNGAHFPFPFLIAYFGVARALSSGSMYRPRVEMAAPLILEIWKQIFFVFSDLNWPLNERKLTRNSSSSGCWDGSKFL